MTITASFQTSMPARRIVRLTAAASPLLLCAVGVELMVLVNWLPDTLDVWFHPDRAGYGDFPVFYGQGQTFHFNATYSPGLAVLMHPLALLSMRHAFWIYTGVDIAALLAIAWAAQASVRSLPAKAAMALGVLALPQSHWVLRVGHFMPVLALATLAGLLLARRRPVIAGLLFGVLALKPQYIIVPLLYLAWTRNWRALAACVGTLAALGLAGICAAAVAMGPGVFGYALGYYEDAAAFVARYVTVGQQYQPYVQGWQYSWYGFLVSAGLEPNPLVAADLTLLSLGAVLLVWWKSTPSVARAATVAGMLLLTPHTTFYNWCLIAVAGVLLMRSDLRPRWLAGAIVAAVALAAAATQKATAFPIPVDVYRPPETRGLFWLQPVTLAALFALVIAGRRRDTAADEGGAEGRTAPALRLPRLRAIPARRVAAWACGAAAMVTAGYLGGAWASGNPPFDAPALFSRSTVLGALPADFPVPPGARVETAGPGLQLPYRVDWDAPAPTSQVAGIMRGRLSDGSWQIVESGAAGGGEHDVRFRTARRSGTDGASIIADVTIAPAGGGSRVRVEFAPLPVSSIPGYDRWLESVGIVVHNVDPESPLAVR